MSRRHTCELSAQAHCDTRAWTAVAAVLAGFIFAIAAWQANRAICDRCTREDSFFPMNDGTLIHARLYRPIGSPGDVPAVIVCHGYLANLGFMEIPWAADITSLGAEALFLDRRGHGFSGGSWFRTHRPLAAAEDEPSEIEEVIALLRAQKPGTSPTRVAILGHSDGGSAAIAAASTDWNVRATVALSASIAPASLVNYVAPQNLLLLYGADDTFVLGETDRVLISRATRGYLNGPGQVGTLGDGSARRLARIAARGHVDVLYSPAVRKETLGWLARSLDLPPPGVISRIRHGWFATGFVALLIIIGCTTRLSSAPACARMLAIPSMCGWRAAEPLPALGRVARSLALAGAWSVGVLLAPRAARWVSFAPAQEGAVVVGFLLAQAITLTALVVAVLTVGSDVGEDRIWYRVRFPPGSWRGDRSLGTQIIKGTAIGILTILGIKLLLSHLYEIQMIGPSRLGLALLFSASALPVFFLIAISVRWATEGTGGLAQAALTGALAIIVGALGPHIAERMAVLPVYLFAVSLIVFAAFLAGIEDTDFVSPTLFGALVAGHLTAAVCALY